MRGKEHRRGLTLAEVLVLLAACAIVALLVAAGLLRARAAARRNQCENNLKQLGLALSNYTDVYGMFPSATVVSQSLPPEKRLSWIVPCLPFVESLMGGLSVDWNKPWDAPENMPPKTRKVIDVPGGFAEGEWVDLDIMVATCPSNPNPKHPCGLHVCNYVGIAGVGADGPQLPVDHPRAGIWAYDRATEPEQISAGLEYTLLLAETALDNGPWTAGGPATVRGVLPEMRLIGPGAQFGGLHSRVANVCFAD